MKLSGGGYRPPKDLNADYRQFIHDFSNCIDSIGEKNEVVITGDVNINLIKI